MRCVCACVHSYIHVCVYVCVGNGYHAYLIMNSIQAGYMCSQEHIRTVATACNSKRSPESGQNY